MINNLETFVVRYVLQFSILWWYYFSQRERHLTEYLCCKLVFIYVYSRKQGLQFREPTSTTSYKTPAIDETISLYNGISNGCNLCLIERFYELIHLLVKLKTNFKHQKQENNLT